MFYKRRLSESCTIFTLFCVIVPFVQLAQNRTKSNTLQFFYLKNNFIALYFA